MTKHSTGESFSLQYKLRPIFKINILSIIFLSNINIYEATVVDRMHHLDLGLFHYQIEYTRQLIKDQHGNSVVNEIDHRLSTISRFSGLKIFSNGIQSIIRLTASEYRDLMKIMLFVVDNLYNQNTNNTEDYVENKYLASLYQNWNEMYIISKYEKFT